jgi:hypothetical protein
LMKTPSPPAAAYVKVGFQFVQRSSAYHRRK